jgi:hypothetical protein
LPLITKSMELQRPNNLASSPNYLFYLWELSWIFPTIFLFNWSYRLELRFILNLGFSLRVGPCCQPNYRPTPAAHWTSGPVATVAAVAAYKSLRAPFRPAATPCPVPTGSHPPGVAIVALEQHRPRSCARVR